VLEAQSVEIDMAIGGARVVGDDGDDLHVEFADAPAIDQIGQAMVEFRREDHHLLARALRPHRPAHAEFVGERREGRAQRVEGLRHDAIEDDAHEEHPALLIVILLRVDDIGAVIEQIGRNGGDDPRPVGAGQCENVLGVWHGFQLFCGRICPLMTRE
jgi:hypothetical protein